ncbi:MAG: hypothetical protein IJP92_00860 [Lachnospiraceae bacterium]|nr:hypothetical protein [Lachnospiraceae bacterium]
MALFLETISTSNEDVETAQVQKYADDVTAAIFYHSFLNTNLRLVQEKKIKSFYANIHNSSGVVLRQERWTNEEPEPIEVTP